jgi:hypothetical protein
MNFAERSECKQTFANPLFLDNNYQWMFGLACERGEMEMVQTEKARVEIKQGEQSAFPLFERASSGSERKVCL